MNIEYTYPSQYPRHAMAMGTANAPKDASAAAEKPDAAETAMFGKDGFGFKDFLDIVNPLQQLPIIGSIYRALTGDTISSASRMAGGFLLGGPIGLAVAAVNSGMEVATGKDVGEQVFALLSDKPVPVQVASAYAKTAALKG